MDAVLNLVCITKTQSELPDEVLQIIKKFMIVPELDKVFNKTDTNQIWEDLGDLVLHYNYAHNNHNFSRQPPPFTLRQQKFSQLSRILDGSCQVKYIVPPPTGVKDRVEWYQYKVRNTILFEALYLYPTLTLYKQSIVDWFRELDIEIIKLGTPPLSFKLEKHIENLGRRSSWNRYHHTKLEYNVFSTRPVCWTFQDVDNDEWRQGYNTNAGTLKKNKKVQKSYLNSLISNNQVKPDFHAHYHNHHANETLELISTAHANETFDKKVGREWLAEGKLDTKTLLRIYGGVRPTYEDSVKKSLESLSLYHKNPTP